MKLGTFNQSKNYRQISFKNVREQFTNIPHTIRQIFINGKWETVNVDCTRKSVHQYAKNGVTKFQFYISDIDADGVELLQDYNLNQLISDTY